MCSHSSQWPSLPTAHHCTHVEKQPRPVRRGNAMAKCSMPCSRSGSRSLCMQVQSSCPRQCPRLCWSFRRPPTAPAMAPGTAMARQGMPCLHRCRRCCRRSRPPRRPRDQQPPAQTSSHGASLRCVGSGSRWGFKWSSKLHCRPVCGKAGTSLRSKVSLSRWHAPRAAPVGTSMCCMA